MTRRVRLRASAVALALVCVVALLQAAPSPASAAAAAVARIGGADRYATSALVSAQTFAAGVPVAYVAAGDAFADALTGSVAASRQGGPVLLVARDAVPAPIAQELSRLRPSRIVVLGGEAVVSREVGTLLDAFTTGAVSRLAGADRYETAVAVSTATYPAGAAVAYLASGRDFPDSLSGAAVAARDGGPLLTADPTALPAVVAAELRRLRPARVVVLGGSGAVSEAVADEAARVSGARIERHAGATRYDTSAAISAAAFAPGAQTVYVASGATFPDALSGAAAARGAPLLLTDPQALPAVIARELIRLRPARIVLLGGESALSAAVAEQLAFAGTDLPAATGGRLTRDSEVRAGACLTSSDASHRLCVGGDGRFGIYRGSAALWTSGTSDAAPRALRIRADGDLVLYGVTGRVIWESSTAGTNATELAVQSDGDLMLKTATGSIVWSSMSSDGAPRWRLPFAPGQRWAAGAPHANSGNTPGARGALDFGPTAGADRRVVTIADGTVYRVQCGGGSYLGVNHAEGWQSTYYHLVNYQEQLVGRFVPAGTHIGDVGRTVPCGGGATFDHVHLVIRRAGSPVSAEGMRFGGYTVRSDGRDYWGFWTDGAERRVLTAPGGAACCLAAQ